jgi:hypothetical protein
VVVNRGSTDLLGVRVCAVLPPSNPIGRDIREGAAVAAFPLEIRLFTPPPPSDGGEPPAPAAATALAGRLVW